MLGNDGVTCYVAVKLIVLRHAEQCKWNTDQMGASRTQYTFIISPMLARLRCPPLGSLEWPLSRCTVLSKSILRRRARRSAGQLECQTCRWLPLPGFEQSRCLDSAL